MKRNSTKLYNVIFPIWLLWLIPATWFIVLPANFAIDLTVVILTLKFLNIPDKWKIAKCVIFRVWIFGFVADLIGTAAMLSASLIDFNYETSLGKWWYTNLTNAVSYNPFESIYALLWVACCACITSCFIYLFNYKLCFRKTDLSAEVKKKMALSLAIFTAPYLFFLPTSLFY